jgi:hypothetical protein
MAKKKNPFLEAYEAKLEAQYRGRLASNTEINMISMLIAGSDLGFIGPKRADLLLARLVEVKMKLAEDLVKDAEIDKELTYTRADLARRLKQILGPDGWIRCRELFPLLRDYW